MNDNDKENEDFKAEYRADKKRNGWFSVVFGIIFIAWTGFDIATNFWEDFWYANVFFLLLGLIFIAYGITDIKKSSRRKKGGG